MNVALEEINISYEQIKRIEVNKVPVFYLENDTVIAYGQINQQPYGCVSNIKTDFYRLNDTATRFIPYAYTSGNAAVSMYLDS